MFKRLGRVQKKKGFSAMVRDSEGEEKVKSLGKELQKAGKLFLDTTFEANAFMIFSNPSDPPPFMSAVAEAHKKGKISWFRPNEIGDKNEKFQVFAEGIEPEDINQGAIGDCYFLAALAICATREELISDLIVEDYAEQGIYGVKFFCQGAWRTVIVDDLLPCWEVSGQWVPIFCRWKGEKETWAVIAEKAWAKLHGSYEAIDGGRTEDALGYLTGGCTETTFFKDRDEKPIPSLKNGKLWKSLLKDHNSNSKDVGCFMSASGVKEKKGGKKGDANPNSVEEGAVGLVSGHAYSVLDIRDLEGHKLIQLRNPWGSYEWGGDWSDHSPLWTESMKKAVDFVAADDGSFWMSFDDFTNEFSQIGVCKTVASAWKSVTKFGRWKAPLFAGGSTEPLGHFNPTFELKNSSPELILQLEQPDQRKDRGDWIICDLRIVKKPESGEIINIYDYACPVLTLAERQKAIEVELDPKEGPYLLVVTAWGAGIEGEFYITIHSPEKVSLESKSTLEPNAEQQGKMTGVIFGKGCANCSSPLSPHQTKSVKGLKFHQGCFKCASCSSTDVYDIGKVDGVWKGFCFPCWNPVYGEKCLHCQKPVQNSKAGGEPVSSVHLKGKLHIGCREEWKMKELEKIAPECFFCHELIIKKEGKYSGQMYEIEGKGRLHEECHPLWNKERAVPCFFCHQPILKDAKFSGRFFEVPDKGHLHEECQGGYNESQAKKCIHCSMALLTIEGKFSGRFLAVENSGVHEECLPTWKAASAEKCFFCSQPVSEIPGKFSGNHFNIEGKGKLHEECGDAWKKSK